MPYMLDENGQQFKWPQEHAKELWQLCKSGLSSKIDTFLEKHPNLVNTRTSCGHTTLALACRKVLDPVIIFTLLRHGFDPTLKDRMALMSAINYSVMPSAGYSDIVVLKLLASAPPSILSEKKHFLKTANNSGRMPLHYWSSKDLKKRILNSSNFIDEALQLLYPDKKHAMRKRCDVEDLSDDEDHQKNNKRHKNK
jgi:hypothetical protein